MSIQRVGFQLHKHHQLYEVFWDFLEDEHDRPDSPITPHLTGELLNFFSNPAHSENFQCSQQAQLVESTKRFVNIFFSLIFPLSSYMLSHSFISEHLLACRVNNEQTQGNHLMAHCAWSPCMPPCMRQKVVSLCVRSRACVKGGARQRCDTSGRFGSFPSSVCVVVK